MSIRDTDVNRQTMTEPSGQVPSGLHSTADTARELARTLERGASTLDSASRTVSEVTEKAQELGERVSAAGSALNERVQEYPVTALATAFVLGFVMGRR